MSKIILDFKNKKMNLIKIQDKKTKNIVKLKLHLKITNKNYGLTKFMLSLMNYLKKSIILINKKNKKWLIIKKK